MTFYCQLWQPNDSPKGMWTFEETKFLRRTWAIPTPSIIHVDMPLLDEGAFPISACDLNHHLLRTCYRKPRFYRIETDVIYTANTEEPEPESKLKLWASVQ